MINDFDFIAPLMCSGCGAGNLHHRCVEVFERIAEDAETGVHVVVEGCQARINLPMDGNPSSRRNGVKIFFDCEECDEVTVLEVIQHKGVTFLSQKSQKHRRSVIVPDENPDITLWEAIQAAQRTWQASGGKD